jgi:hypothetical protein
MAELVIGGTLLGVAKDLLGLFGLFEELLGILVVGIAIGVMLHRQALEGLFDLGLAGVFIHPKDFVVIAF